MIKDNQLYKILVVEDNPGDFVLVQEYISDSFLNAEITNIRSFKEFERTVRTSEDFDIIFLDLSLPDKSGIDLVKAVLAHHDLIPIVVLTGYTDFNFAIQSLSLGISDYLLKENLSTTTIYKCIIYNIERYKTLLKIKESEQRYSDLFQLSPSPLLVYDLDSKKIMDVNDSASQIYQYTKEEFLELQLDDLQGNSSDAEDNNIFINSLEQDYKLIYNATECHKKKNGDLLYVETKKNNFIYKGSKSVIVSIEDLTQEIIQIRSIQQQNKQLREIAWSQSHIVRAPLARMMGIVNLLSDFKMESSEYEEWVKHFNDSASELESIIKDIVSNAQTNTMK